MNTPPLFTFSVTSRDSRGGGSTLKGKETVGLRARKHTFPGLKPVRIKPTPHHGLADLGGKDYGGEILAS